MHEFRKISFHIGYLILVVLFFTHCTYQRSNPTDKETIRNWETQLDTLVDKAKRLKIDEELLKFITIWEQSRQILDLLPDSSKQQKKIRSFFIDILIDVGAYEEAIKQSWQIITINENNDNTPVPNLLFYGTLANLYNKIGETDSAYVIFRLAIARSNNRSNEWRNSIHYNNLGMYFEEQGVHDSAMFYYKLADSLIKARPSQSNYWIKFHGSVRDNIATIYEYQGKFDKAKAIYEDNFAHYENTGDFFRWINAGISLANAEAELHNYNRVYSLLDHICNNMDTLNYKKKHINKLYLFEVYTKYYLENGDFRNAFAYQEKAFNLSDSLVRKKEKLHSITSSQLAKSASQ